MSGPHCSAEPSVRIRIFSIPPTRLDFRQAPSLLFLEGKHTVRGQELVESPTDGLEDGGGDVRVLSASHRHLDRSRR